MSTRAALLGTGATHTSAVSTTNSGRAAGVPVDLVTVGASASLTYDTSHGGYHGDRAIKITTAASAVNCFVRWQAMWRPTAGAAMVATIWAYFTANPPATTSLLQIADASVLRILEIRVTAAGRVRLMNAAGTTLADTTNLIALNQWIRIDVLFTPHASAGQAQLKLYNNPSSSTPTETTTNFTSQNLRTTQPELVFLGITNSVANLTYWAQLFVSDGAPPRFGTVGWVMSRWLGVPTDDEVRVAARVLAATSVRLKVSTTSDLSTSPSYSSSQSPDSDGTVRMAVTGLSADTQYYYGIEVDGVVDAEFNGSFKTAPTPGTQASFRFTAASCAQNNSNHVVFDAIRGESPVWHAHLGDLHYRDVVTNDEAALHKAYDQVMSGPRYARLLGEVPTPYIWSDHDSVGPNGDRTSAALPAANAVYRSRVASLDLPVTGTYFAFSWGRVRCVFTDGRSFMDPIAQTDDASKTKLGATQKAWLLDELTDPDHTVILWFHEDAISNGATFAGDDTWSAYSTERAEIFAAIASSGARVAYICGDLHMLGADDGTNVPTAGAASGVPVYVCSPMDNTSFDGNGVYSAGTYPLTDGVASNLYGVFDVVDTGDQIELAFVGKDSSGTSRITQTFTWTGLADAIAGEVAVTLPMLQVAAAADVVVEGQADVVLPALTVDVAGTVVVDGAVDVTLPALQVTADGTVGIDGQAEVVLPMLEVAAAADVVVDAAAAVTLPALQVGAEAELVVDGQVAVTLPSLQVAATGTLTVDGQADVLLPALQVVADGDLSVEAAVNAVLPMLVVALAGTSGGTPTVTRGSMAANARPAVQASGRPRIGTTMGGS